MRLLAVRLVRVGEGRGRPGSCSVSLCSLTTRRYSRRPSRERDRRPAASATVLVGERTARERRTCLAGRRREGRRLFVSTGAGAAPSRPRALDKPTDDRNRGSDRRRRAHPVAPAIHAAALLLLTAAPARACDLRPRVVTEHTVPPPGSPPRTLLPVCPPRFTDSPQNGRRPDHRAAAPVPRAGARRPVQGRQECRLSASPAARGQPSLRVRLP